ncbi:MAG: hypothetical protein A2138_18550 [Deltaproteobacteria bacterium RBG_16_71_12]|nr:MAG: hypothetical protein A2138_18550 [Deltaproteobacteria bacterium RBG_16_71_12]
MNGAVAGLAGTSACISGYLGDGITPCQVPEAYRGGMDRALQNLAAGQLYSVGLGVEGELPAFWGPAAAAHDSAASDLAAAERDVEAAELRVAWQARRLLRDVEQRRALVQAATLNLTLASEALAAEETKLRAGRSTGFALLRAQELRVGAEVQLTEAKYQAAAANARLLTLMGRISPQQVSSAPSPAAPSAGDG